MHWFYLWKKADFFARCLQALDPFEVGPEKKRSWVFVWLDVSIHFSYSAEKTL